VENLEEVIKKIIQIPLKTKENKNLSLYQIFNDTNYGKYSKNINIENIKKVLLENNFLIDHWFNYSSDKRTKNGYFLREENDIYEIGYLNNNEIEIIRTYNSELEACANFIKSELEYLENMK
jgi:hypothetical protein